MIAGGMAWIHQRDLLMSGMPGWTGEGCEEDRLWIYTSFV